MSIIWLILILFLVGMLLIGLWTYRRVHSTADFFVGGGKVPWWLAGVSHHVSGYSGAVFVAYAAISYTHGFTIYIWWALTIAIGLAVGSRWIAPRWRALRDQWAVESPTEYLQQRYNLPTQLLMAWSGVLLKLFDVGAKWAAIALLLEGFTGTPFIYGILLSGGISLVYISLGGLWADLWTDFIQFLVQLVAGIALIIAVAARLGGVQGMWEAWQTLPASHRQPFHEPYTALFALTFLFINFLSYNGGTWNLATRFIATKSIPEAQKTARLSAWLYLIWPLFLFLPMWLAPILLPDLADPQQTYVALCQTLLPPVGVGIILASIFATTMSMTTSDANTVAAVITRDIVPSLFSRFREEAPPLSWARGVTVLFTGLTLIIAWQAEAFGGVIGLIITWFGALLGPTAIPMMLGLLPAFRRCGPVSAWACILAGLLMFVLTKYLIPVPQALQVAAPLATGLIFYLGFGLWMPAEDRTES